MPHQELHSLSLRLRHFLQGGLNLLAVIGCASQGGLQVVWQRFIGADSRAPGETASTQQHEQAKLHGSLFHRDLPFRGKRRHI